MAANAEANIKSNDVWDFITDIKAPIRNLTIHNVNTFPVALRLVKQNEYTQFYQAATVELKDGSTVADIDVRLSKDRSGQGPFLSFIWFGHCISLDTVKKHYPELQITDVPRGRSVNEVTSHTTPADKQGQEITFSFTESQPDCLHSVVISSKDFS
ncbi:hypothetical protein KXR87_22995 [Yokenella regensburgei]